MTECLKAKDIRLPTKFFLNKQQEVKKLNSKLFKF